MEYPGWSVDVVGTFELLYREGPREMSVEIDLRDSSPVLYRAAIRAWRYPNEADAVTDDDRARIVERLAQYLSDRQFEFQVETETNG